MARSSTFCCQRGVTWRLPGTSSPGRCAGTVPVEVTTDRAPVYPRILDELIPSALHTVEQYANNPNATVPSVLRFLPSRLTYAGIARECLMSVNTVKTHLKRIYTKLGVSSRAETVGRARLLGLL